MVFHLVRKIGFLTLAKITWGHRGSFVRVLDLGTRMPQLLRARDSKDALTELKAIFALDRTAPEDLDIRITGVDDGSVVLRGGLAADRLQTAREALLGVSGVLDVCTDAGAQPTLDATIAARELMADGQRSEPIHKAESWLDERTMPPGDQPKGLEGAGAAPDPAALRRQQQQEMARTGLGTEGQTRGAFFGIIGGAALGAVLGAVAALVLVESSTATRVLVIVLVALAGATAGFVYWGGRTPELENETMTASGEPGIGTTPRNPDLDDRGR